MGKGYITDEQRGYDLVARIRAEHGCWPGLVHHDDGTFSLMHDPDTADARRTVPAMPGRRLQPSGDES
jgi:hypothetical protein